MSALYTIYVSPPSYMPVAQKIKYTAVQQWIVRVFRIHSSIVYIISSLDIISILNLGNYLEFKNWSQNLTRRRNFFFLFNTILDYLERQSFCLARPYYSIENGIYCRRR